MNGALAFLFAVTLLTFPVLANENSDHKIIESESHSTMDGGNMSNHEALKKMQGKMEEMRFLMKKIESEKDVQLKQVLIKEQMKNMNDCMNAMQSLLEKREKDYSSQHHHQGS
jgi:hypothetical protein